MAEGHFCATLTSDHIGATITYMMWCEEHLWNVSVLERVHLYNLVIHQTVQETTLSCVSSHQ
jgi:hypothetical protein